MNVGTRVARRLISCSQRKVSICAIKNILFQANRESYQNTINMYFMYIGLLTCIPLKLPDDNDVQIYFVIYNTFSQKVLHIIGSCFSAITTDQSTLNVLKIIYFSSTFFLLLGISAGADKSAFRQKPLWKKAHNINTY